MTELKTTGVGGADEFEALLLYLKHSRGFDFSGYKTASLMRRMLKRMAIAEIPSFKRYIDFLEVHPEEFGLLFNHLLINVSSFFRDEAAWSFLRQNVLPKILESRQGEPIRIWSAGCAGGKEAYSVAILFSELLGMETFQRQVKIYASDLDQEALTDARVGSYQEKELEGLTPSQIETYFTNAGGQYTIRPELRSTVIFGRHDLLVDAPISSLDLLVCRNTLMYFNAETQNRILARFHIALKDKGYLFLGKAEMLLTHANLFTPVDMKHRVFSKVTKLSSRDRLHVLHQIGDQESGARLTRHLRMRDLAFDSIPVAVIMVDLDGNLTLINDQARREFGLSQNNLELPFRDVEISYRPVELRVPLEQAYSERQRVRLTDIERRLSTGGMQYLDVEIIPILEHGGTLIGASITFRDISARHALQAELQRSKQELETTYEELQSTNEELETTNEELQSTVEELETTNEEIQSTNEELETMNEEMQSANEELTAVNNELRERTDALQRANLFQEAILESMRCGVVVLDKNLEVQLWNAEAEDLWGIRSAEAKGRSLVHLDIGLPVAEIMSSLLACQHGPPTRHVIVVSAVNRRGKSFKCRVTCSPMKDDSAVPRDKGILLFMEDCDAPRASENSG